MCTGLSCVNTENENNKSSVILGMAMHVDTSSREHVDTSSREHVDTSSREHVDTSSREHVDTPKDSGSRYSKYSAF